MIYTEVSRDDLAQIVATLAQTGPGSTAKFAIEGGIKVKAGEGMWTPPYGTVIDTNAAVKAERDRMYDETKAHAESVATTLAEVWSVIDGEGIECEACEATGLVPPPRDNESLSWGDLADRQCKACGGSGRLAPTEYEGQEPYEYLDEMPLEVVYEAGEPFAVVLTVGGPHVEITGGGRQGGYALTVTWGSSGYTTRSEAITRTGEHFREMAEDGR